jgi:hypothetical protein
MELSATTATTTDSETSYGTTTTVGGTTTTVGGTTTTVGGTTSTVGGTTTGTVMTHCVTWLHLFKCVHRFTRRPVLVYRTCATLPFE